MSKHPVSAFLARKDIEVTFQRYAIDALSAMAQGLFASLLIGTILTTVGDLSGLGFFNEVGGFAKSVAGPAMAVAIGYALRAPALVLFSLAAVGFAANAAGGAGGPLAVLVIAIAASELGKAVSKETKVDIIVTPAVTVLAGCGLALAVAPWIGALASSVGGFIMWATELQPLFMGIIVSVVIGIALTLPISSAAICAALGLTGLAGGAALAGIEHGGELHGRPVEHVGERRDTAPGPDGPRPRPIARDDARAALGCVHAAPLPSISPQGGPEDRAPRGTCARTTCSCAPRRSACRRGTR